MGVVKDRIASVFRTDTTKNYSKPTRVNNVCVGQKITRKLKIKKKAEDKIFEAIEHRIIRDMNNLFDHEGQDYYKLVRVDNFFEHESNDNKSKTLPIKECLGKIDPYLKYVTNNLKESDTSSIQLTIAIIFISSKDADEERVMHSKSGSIEMMLYDKVDEVTV